MVHERHKKAKEQKNVRDFRAVRGQILLKNSRRNNIMIDKKQSTKDTKSTKGQILFKDECYAIQGVVFEVYREMGCGFLEAVYQECMEKELTASGIPYVAQQELKIAYKGEPIRQTYRPDLICYNAIIVELKALNSTTGQHQAQLLNYLKSTGMRLGLLVNFGVYPKATVKRVVL